MKKLVTLFIIVSFIFHMTVNGQQRPTVELESVASGFNMVTDINNAGDSRLFVVEQPGVIKILNDDGTINPSPFLDITSLVDTSHNERGLLGLAFHPDYKNNGYFYVNYTALPNGQTHISRFSVNSVDSNAANPASEMIILTQPQPFANHNAGDLYFGPDGYLYFGLGDGGDAGDPQENAQDGSTLLGKMIRIDIDGGTPYSIPATNPFVNDPNVLDEIWAMGLRNPFRFSFDRASGDMWIADVGQNDWEEVNMELSTSNGGMNWGWDCYEGTASFELTGCGPASQYDDPLHVYSNNQANCAVLGGFVYRGNDYPGLQDHYLFTDLCSGIIWTLYPDGAGGFDTTDQGNMTNNSFTTFGEGNDGEMYIAERVGNIFKITASPGTGLTQIGGSFTLLSNAPNPFSSSTEIIYEIERPMHVSLEIFDSQGQLIKHFVNTEKMPGKHTVKWDGTRNGKNLPSGTYFIVMKAEGHTAHHDMIRIR